MFGFWKHAVQITHDLVRAELAARVAMPHTYQKMEVDVTYEAEKNVFII